MKNQFHYEKFGMKVWDIVSLMFVIKRLADIGDDGYQGDRGLSRS